MCFKSWLEEYVSCAINRKLTFLIIISFCRSPHNSVKVMSVGSLLEESDSAVVWRGPRKTALIKRFLKDTFWGRLEYLIFDILLKMGKGDSQGNTRLSM